MKTNPLLKVREFGQSIWLDYTRRDLVANGELRRMIAEDGLRGMTSNPSIFEQAIVGSQIYEEDIEALASEGKSPKLIYESLSQHDVQGAADEFRSVYDETDARDGYVSLEVNPHLAHDTQGTIVEARRLWRTLDRPNVFIKVPATQAGLPAIQQLISEGINVNITLLFGLPRYEQVAAAYLAGIETRVRRGEPVTQVASVASFFVSRIDSLVDPMLEKVIAQGGANAVTAKELRGQIAIASAKTAYQIYKSIFLSESFRKLARRGARTQRLLWASTSTKNPDYDDLKYVESLIGSDTINTVTVGTLDAYRDHGKPQARLVQNADSASAVLPQLQKIGINLDSVTQQLEAEGVEKFNRAFDTLMNALTRQSTKQPLTH
jgi:transaldolase